MKSYSVWVGGGEVNDFYLTKEQAEKLASEYVSAGYTDAKVRKEI